MISSRVSTVKRVSRQALGFFVPETISSQETQPHDLLQIAIIIPTYKPKSATYKLVKKLVTSYTNISIIVVDDCTPQTAQLSMQTFENIRLLNKQYKNITLLRTEINTLKSGALNVGLQYIFDTKTEPDVIVTVDDDVAIHKDALGHMMDVLFSNEQIGAVCTVSWVKNKKKNILTRLQALEYHGFTITKLADNGFLSGPLVMQGMLTAFKTKAIKQVRGFSTDKLIEDYDITVRLKNAGWKVAIAPKAIAWTHVPETMKDLWRQRVRWSYGGIIVVRDFWKNITAIFQDIIGHAVFLTLFTLIVLSFIFMNETNNSSNLVLLPFALALIHFFIAFTFSLVSFMTYQERDRADWALKFTLLPEFAYSNILNAILIGSYIFFIFNVLSHYMVKYVPFLLEIQKRGQKSFQKIGYSVAWGTRNS